ncbi:hypothetical protein KM043_011720 [Ampulex compressa]|uniref:phospholipase A2 n=1 Tax=Ampulex compressa TaxID=860918 RepID=A0A1W6EVP9_AMPCP|nr:venom protein [Ampulex compressa]KAG7210159.1 hypothetical protein KM043_011720 [Ampulex compressa]
MMLIRLIFISVGVVFATTPEIDMSARPERRLYKQLNHELAIKQNLNTNENPSEVEEHIVNEPMPEAATTPRTKWCDPEKNPAYNEGYGSAVDTDQCCRKMKYCDEFIRGKEWKYGLYNADSKPKLSCSCELDFYNCLQDVFFYDEPLDAPYAAQVGEAYFHATMSPCFLKMPSSSCDGQVLYDIRNNTYESGDKKKYFCAHWSISKIWEGD